MVSALYRAAGQAGDHVLAQQSKQYHGGQNGDQRTGHQFAPENVVLLYHGVQTNTDCFQVIGIQIQNTGEQIVPQVDKVKNLGRCDAGQHQRDGDTRNHVGEAARVRVRG